MSARVKVVAAAGLFVFAAGHGSFGHGHASPAGRTEAASAHRIAANGPRNERLAMEMAAGAALFARETLAKEIAAAGGGRDTAQALLHDYAARLYGGKS